MRVKPWHAWSAFWLIVSVIELSGLPDNLATWGGWIGHMGDLLSAKAAQWSIVLVAAALASAPQIIDWLNKRRSRSGSSEKIIQSVQVISMELRCSLGMYDPNKGKCIWSLRSVLFLAPSKPVTLPLHDFTAGLIINSASSVTPKRGLVVAFYQITAWRNEPVYPGSGEFQAKFDGPGRLYVDCENVGSFDPVIMTDDLADVARVALRVGIAEHPNRSIEMRLPLYRISPGEPVWAARPSRIRPLRITKAEK